MKLALPFGQPGGPAGSKTDEWATPSEILWALGDFDMDPCAIDATEDGLLSRWKGLVFMNPPYSDIEPWMAKMAAHGDGIALVFARIDTRWWRAHVWGSASAVLFLAGRLRFGGHSNPAPAPSALVAYGDEAVGRLRGSRIAGGLMTNWETR